MKYLKIFAIALLFAFTACDDDEKEISSYLSMPAEGYTATSTVSSLSFNWSPVKEATQYGWKLTDSEGNIIEGGVVAGTTVTVSGLTPSTPYIFEVWAYSQFKSNVGNSDVITIASRTDDPTKLETPVLDYTLSGNVATVSWNEVEGALSYSYRVTSADGLVDKSESTEDTSIKVKDLTSDVEYTVTVTAVNEGIEWLDSESSSVSFTYIYVPPTVTFTIDDLVGEYTCHTTGWTFDEDWVEFDETYTIDISKVEGSDNQLSIDGFYWTGYPAIGTVDFDTMTITFDPQAWADYYVFAGDDSETTPVTGTIGEDRTITINGWNAWYSGYTYFDSTTSVYTRNLTIDDLTGSFSCKTSGYQYVENEEGEFEAEYDELEITKVEGSDNQISLDCLYWTECPVIGTVDFDTMTITFDAQAWGDWYTFAGNDSETTAIVGTITLNEAYKPVISVKDWNGWYYYEDYATWYSYFEDTSTVYTKN